MRTDNELMALAAADDEEAFAELVTKKRAAFERYAFSLLLDEQTAQDVVQDCFARLYVLRASYQPSFAFDTFFRTMVKNRSIDCLRAQKRPCLPLHENVPGAESPEALFLRHEEKAQVLQALSTLNEPQRALLFAYAVEEKSYRELAAQFHMTLPQVKITLNRIRKALRRAKGDDHGRIHPQNSASSHSL